MPITWRNVDAPSFGESNRLMQSGLDAITGGLQNTSDAITDNWDRVKQQNTDRYAAEIMAAQDMDAVANLRASLTPDQLNGRYEGQIDTVGLMGALQDQGRFVRQDTMEQQQFDDFNTERGERELRNQVMMLQTQGKHDEARALAQNLSNSGELFQNIQQAERGDVQWDWAKTDQAMKVGRYNMDLEDRRLSRIDREAAQQREALGNSLHEFGANLAMDWSLGRAEAREAAKVYARENGIEAKVLNNFLSDFDKNWDNYRGMTPEQEAEVGLMVETTLKPAFEMAATPHRQAIQEVEAEINSINPVLRGIGERPLSGETRQEILKDLNVSDREFRSDKVFDDAAKILGISKEELDPRIVHEAFRRANVGWVGRRVNPFNDNGTVNNTLSRQLIEVQREAVQAQIRVQELNELRTQASRSLQEVENLHKQDVFNLRRSAANMGQAQQNLYEAIRNRE